MFHGILLRLMQRGAGCGYRLKQNGKKQHVERTVDSGPGGIPLDSVSKVERRTQIFGINQVEVCNPLRLIRQVRVRMASMTWLVMSGSGYPIGIPRLSTTTVLIETRKDLWLAVGGS